MKRISLLSLLLISLIAPGCSVVSTIFKAGMWWAFFLIFLVIFIIGFIIAKTRSK